MKKFLLTMAVTVVTVMTAKAQCSISAGLDAQKYTLNGLSSGTATGYAQDTKAPFESGVVNGAASGSGSTGWQAYSSLFPYDCGSEGIPSWCTVSSGVLCDANGGSICPSAANPTGFTGSAPEYTRFTFTEPSGAANATSFRAGYTFNEVTTDFLLDLTSNKMLKIRLKTNVVLTGLKVNIGTGTFGNGTSFVCQNTITTTTAYADYVIDYSSCSNGVTAIKSIWLEVDGTNAALLTSSQDIIIEIDEIYAGSCVTTTGLNGTSSLQNEKSVIFPNPTSGISSVKVYLTKPSTVQLIVNSLAGKEVFSKEIGTLSAGENISEVNFSNLEKGIYSISYIVDGIVAKTEKLVVQ